LDKEGAGIDAGSFFFAGASELSSRLDECTNSTGASLTSRVAVD